MSLFSRARAAYRAFQGHEPDHGDVAVLLMPQREVAWLIGDLYGVIYVAKGDRKKYIHKFNAKDRPVLMSNSDGSQVYILAGGYRFTDRGFVG